MYILKFFGRDELEQMTVSKSERKLREAAQDEIDGDLSFATTPSKITFIYCKSNSIGVIGRIEEI